MEGSEQASRYVPVKNDLLPGFLPIFQRRDIADRQDDLGLSLEHGLGIMR